MHIKTSLIAGFLLMGAAIFHGSLTAHAQKVDSLKMTQLGYELVHLKDTAVWVPGSTPMRKLYLGNSLDAFILSTTNVERPFKNGLTTPRFTGFLHLGVNLSYDFNEFVGIYTGVGIKNIGFIDKDGIFTAKRRVYTVGMPVGIKVGNVVKRNFGFAGAGFDVPFHYKQKDFINGRKTNKINEWFSDRTARLMPYIFVGLSVSPGITLKYQYYPNNFLDNSYTELHNGVSTKPYQFYSRTNLMLLSLGIDFHYRRRPEVRYVDDGE